MEKLKNTSSGSQNNSKNYIKITFISILIFISIFFWIWMNLLVPIKIGVNATENLFINTDDGVKICYNIYEPNSYIIGAERKKAAAIDIANGERITAVIVAHGIMINKETMKTLSLEIASEGFLVVDIDWRSHGRSTGDFNIIKKTDNDDDGESISNFLDYSRFQNDIEAIKNMLKSRGDVNLSNLGYVGMSMGGGIGFYILQNDKSFHAMVGICPASEFQFVNRTVPPNLLMLASKYDEAIPYSSILKVMENKTGINRDTIAEEIRNNSYWEFENGDFSKGTAARLYYNSFMDHFLSPWDQEFIKETKTWLIRSLTPQRADYLSLNERHGRGILLPLHIYNDLIISAWISLIGVLGLAILLINIILSRMHSKERLELEDSIDSKNNTLSIIYGEFQLKRFIINDTIFVMILGFPLMLTFIPFFLLPSLFLSIDLMLLWGPSIAMILYLVIYLKKHGVNIDDKREIIKDIHEVNDKKERSENKRNIIKLFIALYKPIFLKTSLKNIIIGILVGFIFYFGAVLSIGNIFGLVPSIGKIISMILYFPVVFYIYLNFAIIFQGVVQKEFIHKETLNETTKTKDLNTTNRKNSKFKELSKVGILNFAVIMLVTLYILVIPSILSGSYFIMMFLIPITLVNIGTVILGIITYNNVHDLILSALTMTILPLIMFSTLSPLFSILSFF